MSHPTHSYLLRLWREHPGAPARVTLIPVGQPQLAQLFANIEELYMFLRAQSGEESSVSDPCDTTYCTGSETY
jgi:hypothetical protein